jgi:hypothetical protein
VLGPAGTVEGFDRFWSAARRVVPTLAEPSAYPHHRLGDIAALRALVADAGWQVDDEREVVGRRTCTEGELWQWLWGSLSLRFSDGTHLEGEDRVRHHDPIRAEFFADAQRWRVGASYVVPSLAYLVCATATPAPHRCAG